MHTQWVTHTIGGTLWAARTIGGTLWAAHSLGGTFWVAHTMGCTHHWWHSLGGPHHRWHSQGGPHHGATYGPAYGIPECHLWTRHETVGLQGRSDYAAKALHPGRQARHGRVAFVWAALSHQGTLLWRGALYNFAERLRRASAHDGNDAAGLLAPRAGPEVRARRPR